MDKTTYVRITKAKQNEPYCWVNKYTDVLFPVEERNEYFWKVLGTGNTIPKHRCEVVALPHLKPQELKPDANGISYVQVIDSGIIFPVDAENKSCYNVPINDYRQLSKSACIPVQIQKIEGGQHLISTEQVRELESILFNSVIPITDSMDYFKRLFPSVFQPEKTYKVGDRFKRAGCQNIYRVLYLSAGTVGLLNEVDLELCFGVIIPKDTKAITQEEFNKLVCGNASGFTLLPDTTDSMV